MYARAASQTDTQVHLACLRPARPLPSDVAWALARFERGNRLDAVMAFELELAAALAIGDVALVWLDWARGHAWSPVGEVSPRLARLATDVAGSGRRLVLGNAIVEPLGRTPARAVVVWKGAPEQLFRQHTLRTIARVVARLVPMIERLPTTR